MTEDIPIFDKHGRSHYRLCDRVFYDYQGKPRGFLVSEAVYDLRGQHRGFYRAGVMRDRLGMVIGFAESGRVPDLSLPMVDIPPVPFRNLPSPPPPPECRAMFCPDGPPRWSMMPLANMLVLHVAVACRQ